MSRAVSGRRSAIRNATSESWRISLSVSWLTVQSEPIAVALYAAYAALEVLVRRAVVAFRERRALARLALARRRAATRDAAVECAGLDLFLDERHRRVDALRHRPRDLRLHGDREEAANVLEERLVGLREVVRIGREPFHRPFARGEHVAPVLELRARRRRRGRSDP